MNDKRKEYLKKWREDNKEYIRKYKKEYSKTHDSSFKKLQDKCKQLQQENQQLKMINKEYERLNKEKNRGFKITNVQEYNIDELLSYKKYKDNWKNLKQIIKKKFVAQGGFTSYEWNDLLNDLLNKMQELEGNNNDDSN